MIESEHDGLWVRACFLLFRFCGGVVVQAAAGSNSAMTQISESPVLAKGEQISVCQ